MNDFKLIDYFHANPYDKEFNLHGQLNSVVFRDYFWECSSYREINLELNKIFEFSSFQRILSVFLYGYSGSGKTTYIRWFLDKYQKNNYNLIFFDISNTNNTSMKSLSSIKIFDDFFKTKLLKIFDEGQINIQPIIKSIKSKSLNYPNIFTNIFIEKINALRTEKKISKLEFYNFINDLEYQDLLLFLFIIMVENQELFKKGFSDIVLNPSKPNLIIFDNIDHINIEHNNASFPNEIEEIYDKVKRYYDFDSNVKFHFLFTLRDANFSLINIHRLDGANLNRPSIHFPPLSDIVEIVKQRVKIIKKNKISLTVQQEELLNFILNDKNYIERIFLPLFNYNYRKFTSCLCDLLQDYNNILIGDFNILIKYSEIRNGARGIIFFQIFKYIFENDYLKKGLYLDPGEFIGKVGNLNPARIILTDLINLNKFTLNDNGSSKAIPVKLVDLYDEFVNIFGPSNISLFVSTIYNMFSFHRDNWCHLITFINKQIINEEDFNNEKLFFNNPLLIKNPDRIKNIKLYINPAGFIYIRNIIRHYEFFSKRAGNSKSLFNSLECKINDGKIEFEFIENIDKTFTVAKDCIITLFDFLSHERNINEFINSNHTFKEYFNDNEVTTYSMDSQRKGKLYIILIITTHIQYLDTFNNYILEYCSQYLNFYENLEKKHEFQNLKVRINKLMIEKISRYVDFMKDERIKPHCNDLFQKFHNNIDEIKKNYNEYKSVTNN